MKRYLFYSESNNKQRRVKREFTHEQVGKENQVKRINAKKGERAKNLVGEKGKKILTCHSTLGLCCETPKAKTGISNMERGEGEHKRNHPGAGRGSLEISERTTQPLHSPE